LNATIRCCGVRRACASLLWLAVIGASRVLHADSSTPFAAPVQQAVPTPAGGLLRVTVALLLVLAAVLAAAWLARRMRVISGGGGSANLQLLGQLSLGARERAVLVRVGDRQLLIGVAPGHVCTLHVLEQAPAPLPATSVPAPDVAAPNMVAERPSFTSLLLKSLGK
jgi:flagellar protein FliO/FliZ